MTYRELCDIREKYFAAHQYECVDFRDFDYGILDKIMYIRKPGYKSYKLSDAIIMLDTETSKADPDKIGENHLVAWTISIRTMHHNVCTLYGHKPSECINCINMIRAHLSGDKCFIFVFNLSYDWIFLRRFLINEYDLPIKQLNIKSYYPIYIEFENGLVFRDALCLAQRKLEKWAKDMNVEHQKAVGSWDYDLIRNQDHAFTEEEIHYIENDTLAGVECIDALLESIGKKLYSIPWTATGIPRAEVRKRGKSKEAHNAHDKFMKQLLTYDQQEIMQRVFHGGYTHGNRFYYNDTVNGIIDCYDFASSYPYCMLAEKFPVSMFTHMPDRSMMDILNDPYNAYFFKLIMYDVDLKDYMDPIPTLQFSKCLKIINADVDNGRVMACDYCEIWLNEIDLQVIANGYKCSRHICTNVYAAHKDYLPRWFTDYVYELFRDKCSLKNKDRVLYAVAKSKLNSLYGLTVQRPVPETIIEDYITGEYEIEKIDPREEYEKYCKKRSNVLNYQIGCWVTSLAFRNVMALSTCCMKSEHGIWLYTDTDSCYGLGWDTKMVDQYNEICKKKLLANGYGPVLIEGREYWPGVAEHDGRYTQFKVLHAKCYCARSEEDGQLHITVAGVPKNGAEVLNDDIENFRPGCVFPGTVTGKKTYTYFFADGIHIDNNGNEIGDSIDLSPCDYLMSSTYTWDDITNEYIEVPFYE